MFFNQAWSKGSKLDSKYVASKETNTPIEALCEGSPCPIEALCEGGPYPIEALCEGGPFPIKACMEEATALWIKAIM